MSLIGILVRHVSATVIGRSTTRRIMVADWAHCGHIGRHTLVSRTAPTDESTQCTTTSARSININK
eukprot:1191225-Prorocentrum_minimum.AAC.2